jgi:hypothetical protein
MGCFHLLAIVENAATYSVQTSVQVRAFNSFWYLPRSEATGPYDHFIFNFFGKLPHYLP